MSLDNWRTEYGPRFMGQTYLTEYGTTARKWVPKGPNRAQRKAQAEYMRRNRHRIAYKMAQDRLTEATKQIVQPKPLTLWQRIINTIKNWFKS